VSGGDHPDPAQPAVEGRVTLSITGHIAEVCLNRAEKLNALDRAMFEDLNRVIAQLHDARDVRAVVLHGAGRAFCAGLDLAAMARGGLGLDLMARTAGDANSLQQAAWGWRTLPVPVIAAVQGVAFGGGLQILSGADIRIGSKDARLAIREIRWGLVPDMAGMALWRNCVRDDTLRALILTGREVCGDEAQQIGLLTSMAPDPLAQARALAATIAALSPDAVRAAKRLANLTASGATARDLLLAESAAQEALKTGANQREAVRAAIERRPPMFIDTLRAET
jgi:enoyl-CoA hydratase/carnithine racemase